MSAKSKKKKVEPRPVSSNRSSGFNLLERTFDIIEIMARSSVSNVANGVIVSLWINDMLLKGKLISTAADINVTIFSNLNAGASIWKSLFGSAAGTGLTSYVDQKTGDNGKKDAEADIGGIASQLGNNAFLSAALTALAA